MSAGNVVIYFVRRDLRVSDNPILHHLASSSKHGYTHLLPVYVFHSQQVEISGFIKDGSKSPYPQAKSEVGGFWRCGPHRAKMLVGSVWDMKNSLEKLGSGLVVRVGQYDDVLKTILSSLKEKNHKVKAVWMTSDEGVEERRDEKKLAVICADSNIEFRAWADEKYFIDDRDVKLNSPKDLPDVFTTYRKMMEPLRERPRCALPKPSKADLPELPPISDIPPQAGPFEIPSTYEELEECMLAPIREIIPNAPPFPENATSAHPLVGGETEALARLDDIIKNGTVFHYKSSRNGLIGKDFSTKLSAFLAVGSMTGRQIHEALVRYEDGKDEAFSEAEGYGTGENEGSKGVRFELLWRDYMRLCTRKFSYRLFRRSGFRDDNNLQWKSPKKTDALDSQSAPDKIDKILQRLWAGTTGMGLIDASQRELIHTGYTSNRARQNVASFLSKHLGIDWRYGAEWYEMLLVDYDVSSNWSNWQYVSGVGNDPRGEARIFNPVKQAFDYDKEGEYVKMWVPELRKVEKLENVFQACTTSKEDRERFGLTGLEMVEDPVKKIEFSVDGKPNKHAKRPFDRRRKDGRIRSNASMSNGTSANPTEQDQAASNTVNGSAGHQRQHPPYEAPRHPRGDYQGGRGDFRGGRGRGSGEYRGGSNNTGGYRGRGYGGSRGEYRGAYRGNRGHYQGIGGYGSTATSAWSPAQ
ncbi:DASH family cryptochrome [Truncatella angustata]|uniref:Cryptochrome DASH n=1 Tax=Truncatella angustata TaxID=152316 RepID=A0A9P8UCM9_9PEZI|nr:DASH family cryptochrome [Truncatella angustata]KAH6646896.1 DASH family cryptochrome [Truncatella angustata]